MKPIALLALVLVACAAKQPTRSTSSFAFRAEGGGGFSPDYGGAGLGSASAAFATEGVCCGLGAYVLGLGHWGGKAKRRRVDTALSAGLEMSSMVSQRIGVQLRAGAAGTPPTVPMLGRRGFLGSGTLVLRLSDPTPPAVSAWAPLTELGLGVSWLSLNAERSSAGPSPTRSSEPTNAFDVLLTLRFGAAYGLELK